LERTIKPNQAVVQEPTNQSFKIQRVHAPTIPQEDALHVPVKHDFNHTFDVPPFAGKTTAYVLAGPRGRGRNKK
jgi:hypothetical protein